MSRNLNRSLWSRMFGDNVRTETKSKSRLLLEVLEDRAVPATIVTNLLDNTNVSSPLAGSLREAITQIPSDGIIEFDPALFPDTMTSPQTLVLNGAVGRLQINNGANLTIQGPGKFTDPNSPNFGKYKLIIQSDVGFISASVPAGGGGSGFRIGDKLQQGYDEFNGGARFSVLNINDLSDGKTDNRGAITSVAVIQSGANSTFLGSTTAILLSTASTGLNQLTPIGGSTGSGAQLTISPRTIDIATGLVQVQMTPNGPRVLTLDGIEFGSARGDNVIANQGSLLVVDDCTFSNKSIFPGTSNPSTSYIKMENGGGDLTIVDSDFSNNNGTPIIMENGGNLTVNRSTFINNGTSAITFSGGSITVTNSTIKDNGATGGLGGINANANTSMLIDNTLFQNNTSSRTRLFNTPTSALAILGTGSSKISNSYFEGNQASNNGISFESGTNRSSGGAAIIKTSSGNLSINNTIFKNNSVNNISQRNSGGGAIYNLNGTMNITDCGFEGNAIKITGYPNPNDPAITDYLLNPEKQPSARYSGGGAVYSGGNTTIASTYFENNSVESQVDFWQHNLNESKANSGFASKPLYSGGGALYLTSSSNGVTNSLTNITVTGNSAVQTAAITDTSLSGAGAVFVPLSASPSALTLGKFANSLPIPFPPRALTAITINATNTNYSVVNNSSYPFGMNITASTPTPLTLNPSISTNSIGNDDFDRDGNLDFVVANTFSNSVSIYLGNGDGTFESTPMTIPVGTTINAMPTTIAVADFDGDLNPDIAVGNSSENTITVILNPTIPSPTLITLGTTGSPVSISAVDNSITVALSNGQLNLFDYTSSGGFRSTPFVTPSAISPLNFTPSMIVVANPSGIPGGPQIAVVTDPANESIYYYERSSLSGPFTPPKQTIFTNILLRGNSDPVSARFADVDGDGDLDIVASIRGYNTINVYTNNGSSSSPYNIIPQSYDSLKSPIDVQIGDMNEDLIPDMVILTSPANELQILYGLGNGAFTRATLPTGRGLNGGAIIIADGREFTNPNNTDYNLFNGSNTTTITNSTITGNYLSNNYATSSNSNNSTADAGYFNRTDTGGIFIDTQSASQARLTNTILSNNVGIVYGANPNIALSNSGVRYQSGAGGAGSIGSSGNSMYDPTTSIGLTRGNGDITQSDDTANLDPRGLQTDPRATQIGLTSNPLYHGTIKYIPIDRLSPARDAGVNVTLPPTSILFDTRGANRLINTNVDIGAFEVQYATKTFVTSPFLNPADSTHPYPFTSTTYGKSLTLTAKAQWDDNIPPNVGIEGVIELVRSSDNVVIALGALVPVSTTNFKLGGTVSLTINDTLAKLLDAGPNTLFFRYSGDKNYAVSLSNPFDVIVAAAPTTATLAPLAPNPAGRNEPVTFSGSLVAPLSTQSPVGFVELGYQTSGGAFTPFYSNVPVATDGTYSITIPTGFAYGEYTIVAQFDPTDPAKFASANSNSQPLSIGVVPTVSLFPFANNPVAAGSAVTFSAIVEQTDLAEPLTGSVDFLVSGTNVILGSVLAVNATPVLNGLMYTFTSTDTAGLTLGSQSIVARYNQEVGGSYATTVSSPQDLTVTGFNSTISMGVTPATTITYGTKINLSATVASAGSALPFSNGTVTFYEGSTVLGTPVPVTQGTTAPPLNILLTGGTHTLDAGYSGDGVSYNPSTSTPINVVVNPASATMTLVAPTPQKPVKLGTATTFVSTLSTAIFGTGIAGLTGQVVYTIRINGAAPVTIGTVSLVKTGTSTYTATLSYRPPTTGDYSISARYTGDTNFAVAAGTITQTFRVNRVVVQRFYAIAPGTGSTIQLFSTTTNTQMAILRPLGASYTGGFRVNSTGDVTGDGVADLVFTPKTGSFVRIVDGRTLNNIGGFYAFTPSFGLPVNITTGDVNGDFRDDIIVAPGGSGAAPTVKAFNGANLSQVLWSKLAYASTFLGGVTLATADVNNDGRADVITGPMNGGPANVRVFNGINGNLLKSFVVAAYGSSFSGGIFVAANVAANTGAVEIITSVNKGLPQVVVTNYSTLATRASFYAFSSTYQGGCRVTVADTNGDGIKELLVGVGPNAGPLVARYNSNYQRIDQFFAFGPAETLSYNSGLFLG